MASRMIDEPSSRSSRQAISTTPRAAPLRSSPFQAVRLSSYPDNGAAVFQALPRICNNELQVQVFRGIGELAFAAGQTLALTPRDCRDFPLELQFVYQGVTFCQLKSAQVMANLVPGSPADGR